MKIKSLRQIYPKKQAKSREKLKTKSRMLALNKNYKRQNFIIKRLLKNLLCKY